MYLNKSLIYGNLTRDPELKVLPSGQPVCSLFIATNRTYTDKDGNRQEQVEYHNVVVFGKQAENVGRYLTKGSGAYIEGRLQTRSWDKDGVKLYRTEIIAERVQFGPGKNKAEAPTKSSTPAYSSEYPEEEINPEDIPF